MLSEQNYVTLCIWNYIMVIEIHLQNYITLMELHFIKKLIMFMTLLLFHIYDHLIILCLADIFSYLCQ